MGLMSQKVAVVTGGGSGIGKGIADAFSREGCSVVIAGRTQARLEGAAKELGHNDGSVIPVTADVSDPGQVKALFDRTLDEFGRLDVLVNNASSFGGARFDQIPDELWNSIMSTGLNGAFYCSREAFRIMMKAGGGRIINIGSVAAYRPREHAAAYAVSKAAIASLTQCIALDGREFGIAASCLHPGNTSVERRTDGRPGTGRDDGPEEMMSVEEIARSVLLMATLSPGVNMLEATVLPVKMKYLSRG